MPIELVGTNIVFTENNKNDKNKLFAKDYLNLNRYATPQNVFDALCEYYSLHNMSVADAIKVASVHFAMVKADFSKNNPFTIAENVPDEVILIIKEQSRFYRGVETRIDTERAYYDGTIAPHIIGYYDYLNAEEYASVTEKYKESLKDENLTEEEIDKAVKEAEAHAAEDKKKKEEVEVRNNADSLVYNTEKTLKELEGKISDDEKAKVEAELANVKKTLEGTVTFG